MRGTDETDMVGVYYRVSTADQTTEQQKISVAEYCQRSGIAPVKCKVYEDFVSGVTDNRTFLNAMIQDIKSGVVRKVIIWRLDRLGRSVSHLVQLMELFREYSVEFISVKEGYDTATSHGRLLFHIMASMSEFERELIRERCILSIKKRRALGLPVGKFVGALDRKKRKTAGYFRREAQKRIIRNTALLNLVGNKIDVKALQKQIKKDQAKVNKVQVNDTK